MFEKKLSNKPSRLLSDAENMLLFSILRKKSVSLTTTVARLYNKHGREWVLLHTVTGPGVVCFERDANTKSYYLRFYNLERKKLAYEQLIPSEGIWLSRDSNTFFRLTANSRRIIVGFEFNDTPAALEEMEELALALQGKHDKLKKAAAARAAEEKKQGGHPFHVTSFFHKKGKYTVTPKMKEKSCSELSSISRPAVLKSVSTSQSKVKETSQKPINTKSESTSQSKMKKTSEKPTDSRPSSAEEANKASSVATPDEKLDNDPSMAYLFNRMGCDYAKIMEHKEARKKVEDLVAKYGGINVFKNVVKQNGITEEVLLVQPSKSDSSAWSEQSSAADSPNSRDPFEAPNFKINPARVSEAQPSGLIRIPPPPKKHTHWEVFSDMRMDKSPKGNPQQPSPQAVPKEDSHHPMEESAENPFLAELEETIVDIERTAAQSAGEAGKDTFGSTASSESQWSDDWDEDDNSMTQEWSDDSSEAVCVKTECNEVKCNGTRCKEKID